MMRVEGWRWIVAGAVLVMLTAGAVAFAQTETGVLVGSVTDDKDQKPAPLAGVTVTLTGGGDPRVQTTDAKGLFRFTGIPAGDYSLRVERQGFTPVDYPKVVIVGGYESSIEAALSPAPK